MIGIAIRWAAIATLKRYFTVDVAIAKDHKVIDHGLYRIVRHPGYAGGLIGYLFIPVLLDSAWAFLPALLLAVVMVLRTSLEDRTLQAELPGYRDFAARTRYRLLPGVW